MAAICSLSRKRSVLTNKYRRNAVDCPPKKVPMKSLPFPSLWQPRRRLLYAAAAALYCWLVLQPAQLAAVSRTVLAFDAGVLVYLLLIYRLMHPGQTTQTFQTAEDEGGCTTLLLAAVASAVSLWAIFGELAVAQSAQGWYKTLHILLTVATIILSWLFIHILFALHYARLYYRERAAGNPPCLLFPENPIQPDYGDFVYFSCVIGTSGQTADVSFASTSARRIGLLHCVLAFFYNAAVLSMMINIASGLVS